MKIKEYLKYAGEAQKISFVRLIIENKPINIMDEPTSEIDIKSEDHICQILPGYLEGKTIIIITHRPRTKYFN